MQELTTGELAKRARVSVVDGKPADCCTGRGVDAETPKEAGVGVPLS